MFQVDPGNAFSCVSQEQEKELRQQDEFSSLVWICTSTHTTSKVIVIDANQPGKILENFFVCNSHLLCITSVPGGGGKKNYNIEKKIKSYGGGVFTVMSDDCAAGARETDYPAGEEVPPNSCHAGGAEGASQTGTAASSSSVLDGITVVGCSVEGAVAVPQTAGTDSLDGKLQ